MNRPRLLVVINQGDGSGQCRSAITIAKLLSLGLRPNGSRQDIDLSNKMEEQSAEPNHIDFRSPARKNGMSCYITNPKEFLARAI